MYYYLEYVFPGRFKDKCDRNDEYNFVGSFGTGGFPHALSLSILDKDITNKPTENIYVVYIFSKNLSYVYLSLSISSSQYDTQEELLNAKRALGTFIEENNRTIDRCFSEGMDLELDENNNSICQYYPDGSIIFKKYDADNLPDDRVLFSDLKKFLRLYKFIKDYYSDPQYIHLLNRPEYEDFSENDLYDDVYMDRTKCEKLRNLLIEKKNVIIQGPPGVGKTYIAKLLAYSIMNKKDDNCIHMVQFHQSYSYEDFIMGYRPYEDGFELKEGPFYKFCLKAKLDPDNDYFFIIDEINRGNLNKIFGELFMLIENDKRNEDYAVELLYSNSSGGISNKFFIPENVHIIGLMNTADRSLDRVDYALRRRFSFFSLEPGFNSDNFTSYQDHFTETCFGAVIGKINTINNNIKEDDSLKEGFCIGHSYFCGFPPYNQETDLTPANFVEKINKKLTDILEFEIQPLLEEYWFDEPNNQNIRDVKDLISRISSDDEEH